MEGDVNSRREYPRISRPFHGLSSHLVTFPSSELLGAIFNRPLIADLGSRLQSGNSLPGNVRQPMEFPSVNDSSRESVKRTPENSPAIHRWGARIWK